MQLIAALWRAWFSYADADPVAEREFRAYALRLSASGTRMLAGFLLVGTALYWPLDQHNYAAEPDVVAALTAWRLAMLALTGLTLLLYRSGGRLRSSGWHPTVFALGAMLGASFTGGIFGAVSGLERPFFYGAFCFSGFTMVLLVPVLQRLLISGLFASAFVAAFFLPYPENRASPYVVPVLQILFAANLWYVIVGHGIYHLTRLNFLQGLALAEKAAQLSEANRQSERLLLNILPKSIAERLKRDERAIADGFSDVTVLFADIADFTSLSSQLSPDDLVALLNRVFSAFDIEADRHGLEKIKTIGDAYMVAGGLPEPRADHAQAVAEMALGMQQILSTLPPVCGRTLQMRIGIHSGPVVAGVIGQRKFIYDLWGDTVNTASRMESHGVGGTIQISDATRQRLGPTYRIERRGVVDIKGKGPMEVFRLLGH